jgi:ribosome-binding protein aMBF1 (putative translation factor)
MARSPAKLHGDADRPTAHGGHDARHWIECGAAVTVGRPSIETEAKSARYKLHRPCTGSSFAHRFQKFMHPKDQMKEQRTSLRNCFAELSFCCHRAHFFLDAFAQASTLADVMGNEIRVLRSKLGLSRAHLARFLGVSEATVVRWEAEAAITEPKGLQAVLLQTLVDAANTEPTAEVGRMVRSCGVDHRKALRSLLDVGT